MGSGCQHAHPSPLCRGRQLANGQKKIFLCWWQSSCPNASGKSVMWNKKTDKKNVGSNRCCRNWSLKDVWTLTSRSTCGSCHMIRPKMWSSTLPIVWYHILHFNFWESHWGIKSGQICRAMAFPFLKAFRLPQKHNGPWAFFNPQWGREIHWRTFNWLLFGSCWISSMYFFMLCILHTFLQFFWRL